jgi:hypothetical protein
MSDCKKLFSRLSLFLLISVLLAMAPSDPAQSESSAAYLIGEYKLPASLDTTVAADAETELWAAVYRPKSSGRYPLLVFLHGNHGTCGFYDAALGIRLDYGNQYSKSGKCPKGWIPTPNHLGYGYLASELASLGYVVVSINANRGVNAAPGVEGDFGLNLRRGRLVLRHLEHLARWNSGKESPPKSLGFTLRGLMDFGHIGLLGHSRGGEGMRAALYQYSIAGSPWPARIGAAKFEALFEIGPVDGMTALTLNAGSVAWNVLIPGCDGDVSDLQGIKPFDRMIMKSNDNRALPKSSFLVYGANHNFYNTEWQQSDSISCWGQPLLPHQLGGSAEQRITALQSVIPFFRAHVGPAKLTSLASLFDPSQPLPAKLRKVTYFARGHTASLQAGKNLIIDDFDRRTGISSGGAENLPYHLENYTHGDAGQNHDKQQRAATVRWSKKGAYLQLNASMTGVSIDPAAYKSLEFRIKLDCVDLQYPCAGAGEKNPSGVIDFSIQLVSGNKSLSVPVVLSSVAKVYRPAGAFVPNPLFQTVRIPITAFKGVELRQFRGVRFMFDRSPAGAISFGNVRLVSTLAGGAGPGVTMPVLAAQTPDQTKRVRSTDKNEIVSITRHVGDGRSPGVAGKSFVEIELASTRRFGVTDALPELRIADKIFRLSRFADDRTDRMIFTVSDSDYQSLPADAAPRLVIGGAPVWNFGPLPRD